MIKKILYLLVTLLPVFCLSAVPENIGFILEFEGDVTVHRDVGVKTLKPERIKTVILDGLKKQSFKALKFEKLFVDDIIITASKSKAKIVLKNKNIVFVDEWGQLVIPKEASGADVSSGLFNIVYGKFRGVVVKGEKEKADVKSPSAVMGIRGTDFMIEYSPTTNKTTVSVLRGEVTLEKKKEEKPKEEVKKNEKVEVKEAAKPEEPIVVKAGYTAAVKAPPPQPTIQETAKQELQEEKVPEPKQEEIVQPQKITLEKLDEAKLISMVETKKIDEKTEEPKEMKEIKKEALKAQAKVEEAVKQDIIKYQQAAPAVAGAPAATQVAPVSLNDSLDSLLDKRLAETGINPQEYKKVPVEARVKVRNAGMKDDEITPRRIREKSKTSPEVKSVFDNVVDFF